MSGFKERHYDLVQGGIQGTPDELDRFEQYVISYPGLTATALGTVTSTGTAAFVFDNVKPDYPRNALVSILGVAGGMGGTVTLAGKNQFNDVVTETVGFGSANGGGSVAGTVTWSQLTAATITGLAGLGGTAVGTARIGYAVGTAAGLVARFGLPVKIAALTDVRRITFTSQGIGGTALNGGTIDSSLVDVANHQFKPGRIMAGTEVYTLTIKSTYDNAGKANLTKL